MATYVVPFRPGGKSRLGDAELAEAMLADVVDACAAVGAVIVADAPGGQGEAVASVVATLEGTVAVVNSDVPCVTPDELEQLVAAAPSLVAARDGTTNAVAVAHARDFVPLYGAGSALRFERQLGARLLDLPGLRDDVDTWVDIARVRDRAGPRTRAALRVHA